MLFRASSVKVVVVLSKGVEMVHEEEEDNVGR